jgi:hypothetical protein
MKPTLHRRERGAAALTVTMLLLFTTALAVFYLNRGMVFEQRTSANQMKSTSALEAAEAGVEWATGMLNAPYDIGNDCAFQTTTNVSFRKRYVMTKWNDATNPTSDIVVSDARPGCRFVNGALQCTCPAPSTAVAPTIAGTGASFSVQFTAVADEAVRITAWGCAATAGGAVCNPDNSAAADANARVTAVVKLKPVLRAAPSSPLTCGTSCTLGGSANLQNDDVATNGVLVNAGTSISTSPGISLDTLPGQPTQNALIPNDDSLSALSSTDPTCSNSNMFRAYFGSTIEAYRNTPSTKVLSCSSASDCQSQLFSAYNDGWRAFFFDSDVHLSGNHTLGSAADPVTLVTASALDINGTWDIYGLLFSNSATWNDLGTGTATIHGAQISCAAYSNNGNGTLTYDAEALKNARRFSALMVRVPGSWKDF